VDVRVLLMSVKLCGALHNCIYVEPAFMWSDRSRHGAAGLLQGSCST
jgi:hypothetical protein